MNIRYFVFNFLNLAKKAAYSGYTPASLQEASSILDIKEPLTNEVAKKAHKKMVVQYHPDRGGNEETLKKINAAYEYIKSYLENGVEPIKNTISEVKSQVEPDLSYEDIAELRKEMGREEFEKRFPGWLSELKNEMGLDSYNLIFEGYDPNYNPDDDPYYQDMAQQNYDWILDEIYDSIDLSAVEDKLTLEDINWIINVNNADDILNHLINLGADVNLNKLKSSLNKLGKKYKKVLLDILLKKIKEIISYNESLYNQISMLDIAKDYKNIIFFNEKFHYSLPQLKTLIIPEFIEQLKIAASTYPKYGGKIVNLSVSNKIRVASYFKNVLVETLKKQGFNPNQSAMIDKAFEKILYLDNELFDKLIDLGNPINYQK